MIIGVCGKARSGKDTIAEYLVEEYGFTRMALADPLRTIVAEVFAVDPSIVWDSVKREQPLEDWPGWTVRKLLQFVGTELFRTHIDPNIWVKSLCLKIAKQPGDYVVPDVRFPNERNYLLESTPDSFCIKVVREGCDGQTVGGIKKHVSEQHDIDAEFTIENNATKRDLYKQIDEIMLIRRKHEQNRICLH